jgi:hypothetical protein
MSLNLLPSDDKSDSEDEEDSEKEEEEKEDKKEKKKVKLLKKKAIKQFLIHEQPQVITIQVKRFMQSMRGSFVKIDDYIQFPLDGKK